MVALLIVSLLLAGCGQPAEQVTEQQPAPVEEIVAKPEPGAMVKIPAGEFTMGSDTLPGRPPLAGPAHKVNLPAYEIDVYEVTNAQFARFQIESDYRAEGDWRSYYKIGREDYPVANVTWNDAKAFCEWAGKRLPTEAEWEKAARGEQGLKYPWGDVFDWTKTNTNEHGDRDILAVGSIEGDKSPYGLYDVMGNVQEWTSDLLKPYPGGSTEGLSNVYNGQYYVVRGGSYAIKGDSTYLWSRSGYMAKAQFGLGFRCAKDASGQ